MKSVVAFMTALVVLGSCGAYAGTLSVSPHQNIYEGAGLQNPILANAVEAALKPFALQDAYQNLRITSVGRAVFDLPNLSLDSTWLRVDGYLEKCAIREAKVFSQAELKKAWKKMSLKDLHQAYDEFDTSHKLRREDFLRCGESIDVDGTCWARLSRTQDSYYLEIPVEHCPFLKRYSAQDRALTLMRQSPELVEYWWY